MSNMKSLARETCTLLAVQCGNYVNRQIGETEKILSYPFPEIASAGRVEVHKLVNPTFDQFKEAQRSVRPIILFCQGEKLSDEEEIGSLIWGTIDASDNLASLIDPPLPTIVYLEVPNGEKIAQSLHLKGVPYVIYWKKQCSSYSASHFFEALVSVVQSSLSHTWDAFQIANASFQLYCTKSNCMSKETNGQRVSVKLGPHLLGAAPEIHISAPEANKAETEEEEEDSETSPAIKVYKEDVDVRFLICGLRCGQDAFLLGSLEDGLSALLNVEIRGSKLQNRVSASPPLEAGTLSHGIVTMRCDITTCSSAHISLLVSGGAQTCFDDQLLETHIKNELIEKTQLVRAMPGSWESYGAQQSLSVAWGGPVFEVRMVVPKWASQVLKHVAKEASYRSLVALGIASLDGTPVASFDKRDANRILFFSRENKKDSQSTQMIPSNFHLLTCSSCPTKERAKPGLNPKLVSSMRPIPHFSKNKLSLYFGADESSSRHEGSAVSNGNKLGSAPVTVLAVKKSPVRLAPKVVHRKPLSQPVVPINLPKKKHGCTRSPIRICPEEEFLKDVMQFLVQRGHSKLVPQGGLSEFPDAILNAKRLDLYNLYKEVVSRGGFFVGNGINWKGQVFSKMRNHTISNRMTGVGNTLKKHYENYLLEYELAHDDVDGECCLLCRSSSPGDWVNCGLCGEWAHFGCDRRQGLGTFKDYAKTDGLEYICPHCSVTSVKKKAKFSNGLSTMRTVATNA